MLKQILLLEEALGYLSPPYRSSEPRDKGVEGAGGHGEVVALQDAVDICTLHQARRRRRSESQERMHPGKGGTEKKSFCNFRAMKRMNMTIDRASVGRESTIVKRRGTVKGPTSCGRASTQGRLLIARLSGALGRAFTQVVCLGFREK